MMITRCAIALLGCCVSWAAWAGDDKLEAAVGGGVGGAVGAVVGQEIGDRKGAIVGAGVGAAIGAAIATDDDDHDHRSGDARAVHVESGGHSHGHFCPPGQAKKGRC